jgi:hypothetical protein
MPNGKNLAKKTPAEDAASIDGIGGFTEMLKAKIISNKLKELAGTMDLTELKHLVSWLTVLRDKRVSAAKKTKGPLQRLRVSKKV